MNALEVSWNWNDQYLPAAWM